MTARPVIVPQAWREATRADRLARTAALLQRPDLAAAELRRAARLLGEAASEMERAGAEMGSGPTRCS